MNVEVVAYTECCVSTRWREGVDVPETRLFDTALSSYVNCESTQGD